MQCEKKYLLSIIIPIYNGEKYINRCIFSFIDEMNENSELILVDDGSKDQTQTYCERIIQKYPKHRIVYFKKKNQGVSSARNKGLDLAKGEWIYFVDIDDYLISSWKLFESYIYNDDVDLVLFKTQLKKAGDLSDYKGLKENESHQYKKNVSQFLLHYQQGLFFQCWNKLYRKSIIEAHELSFDSDYRMGEDLIFNLHYLNCCNRVSHRDENLYIYEIGHSDAVTYTLDCQWFSANLQALELVNLYFVRPASFNYESSYSAFIKRYVRIFLRMLIVFDEKNTLVSEKTFIKNVLDLLDKQLNKEPFINGGILLIKGMNHFWLTPSLISYIRKIKKRMRG